MVPKEVSREFLSTMSGDEASSRHSIRVGLSNDRHNFSTSAPSLAQRRARSLRNSSANRAATKFSNSAMEYGLNWDFRFKTKWLSTRRCGVWRGLENTIRERDVIIELDGDGFERNGTRIAMTVDGRMRETPCTFESLETR